MACATYQSSVCFISHNRLFAETMRSFLTRHYAIAIVGVEADPDRALEMVKTLRPDLIIVEEPDAGIHSPVLRAIVKLQAAGRVVVLGPEHESMLVFDWRHIPGSRAADFLMAIQEGLRS
jgi:DNA-binding NarL/FixJ family response regulator